MLSGPNKKFSPEFVTNCCRLVCKRWNQSLTYGHITNRAAHVKQRTHDLLLAKAKSWILSDGISNKLTVLTFILHEPDHRAIQEAIISIMSTSPKVIKLTLGMTPESFRSPARSLWRKDMLIQELKDALLKMTSLRTLFVNLLIKPMTVEFVLRAVTAKEDLHILALRIEVLGHINIPQETDQDTVIMANLRVLVVDMRGCGGEIFGRHFLSKFDIQFPSLCTLALALPREYRRPRLRMLQSANDFIHRFGVQHFVLMDEAPRDNAEDAYTLHLPDCVTQVAIPQHFTLKNLDGQQSFPNVERFALICDVLQHEVLSDRRDSIEEIETRIRMCGKLAFPALKSVRLLGLSMQRLMRPSELCFKSLVNFWLLVPRLQSVGVALSDDEGTLPCSMELPVVVSLTREHLDRETISNPLHILPLPPAPDGVKTFQSPALLLRIFTNEEPSWI